jgi:hypothetical protein
VGGAAAAPADHGQESAVEGSDADGGGKRRRVAQKQKAHAEAKEEKRGEAGVSCCAVIEVTIQ